MDFQKRIKKQLSSKRYEHSVRVAETAVKLARLHGCNEEKAEIAGLLHDYCKEYPKEEQVRIAVEQHLLSSREDLLMPQVLHGPVASYILKQEGLVDDESVLQAVRYHTTGHPDMDTLAKIIFIADYIEPNRKIIPGLQEIRETVFVDIDHAICLCAGNTVNYLCKNGKPVDPMSIETYQYYSDKGE